MSSDTPSHPDKLKPIPQWTTTEAVHGLARICLAEGTNSMRNEADAVAMIIRKGIESYEATPGSQEKIAAIQEQLPDCCRADGPATVATEEAGSQVGFRIQGELSVRAYTELAVFIAERMLEDRVRLDRLAESQSPAES